ncbi:MAG: hypothetical protein JW918_03525 [Anaerolineae bacterium]|nr:hypothetical protein [Anaerolineae bacterium]
MSDSANLQTDPVVGALRVAGGARRDAAPCAMMVAPPPRAARGREGERLFILLDLTGPVTPHLYREMREVVMQEYWSTRGSVTAAMRQATAAANRHLFQFNLSVTSSNRCYGGLALAVLHGEDIFIVQTGPGRTCVLRRNQFECFPRGEELPHLGMGVVADVRLYHTFAAIGDTLLLVSSSLARAAGDAGLARVLPRPGVDEVLAGLEQVGAGVDFIALVARLVLPAAAPRVVAPPRATAAPPQPGVPPLQPETSTAQETSWRSISARVTEGLQRTRSQTPRPAEALDLPPAPRPEPPVLPEPARKPGPALGERVWKDVQVVGRGFGERVKDGARAVGHGIVAAGTAVADGARALFRRMLPGAERRARRQERQPRPVPKENRVVMMAIAIGLPILMGIFVWLAWKAFGEQTRLENLKALAAQEVQQAQTASVVSETRQHWNAVLGYAERIAELQPEDAEAVELREQASRAIDELDGIVRLAFVKMGNFGESSVPRQLVVHGQTIFVLDPAAGWAAQVDFNLTGDGSIVPEMPSTFARTGLEVDGSTIGSLVDFAWVEPGSGRMAGGLVILDENGGIVGYDPAWGSEAGEPHLTRSLLGKPPRVPRAVDSFEGRLYVLDPSEEQIWRYEPQGDLYPDLPSPYFVVPPIRPLGDAMDMAIDANIYVLHADGTIDKYLSGEAQVFDTGGVPGGFNQPIALAVDPDGDSGRVYVADAGGKCVVVLGADGAFCAQFRADEAFDALEALAVDEAAGRFYAFSGGQLYVAPLPRLP